MSLVELDQLVPSHSSTADCLVDGLAKPPEYKATVVVPAPAPEYLAVFKAFLLVHDEPSYCSV